MRTLKFLTVITMGLFSFAANAAIKCEFETQMGVAVVTIDVAQVTISGAALEKEVAITNPAFVNDGHMTAMVTAPGFAFTYQNHYGCIREPKLITNLRTLSAAGYIGFSDRAVCTGGSTADRICSIHAGITSPIR